VSVSMFSNKILCRLSPSLNRFRTLKTRPAVSVPFPSFRAPAFFCLPHLPSLSYQPLCHFPFTDALVSRTFSLPSPKHRNILFRFCKPFLHYISFFLRSSFTRHFHLFHILASVFLFRLFSLRFAPPSSSVE